MMSDACIVRRVPCLTRRAPNAASVLKGGLAWDRRKFRHSSSKTSEAELMQ
jgi:hypothetical protein